MVNKIQITYAFIRYIRFQIKKIDQKIKILMSISSLFDPLILPLFRYIYTYWQACLIHFERKKYLKLITKDNDNKLNDENIDKKYINIHQYYEKKLCKIK